mmetsp:Transcript_53061/g.168396  ORF Transcript_53061/g.168396 Transcript_53061/m.168396 type:complete len:124 (+) Transcript_53061:798-1169(+)
MGETKTYTLEECAKHNSEDDCWLIIEGKVYDVTKFMDEHPGGGEVMLSSAGRDATDDFEDVGHSGAAREMLRDYLIGDFKGGVAKKADKPVAKEGASGLIKLLQFLVPVLVILLAIWTRSITK